MFQHRRVIVSAIALLLVFLMTGGMAFSAYAESSSTIKARIESLKEQEQEIAAQKAEVRAQREANESDILDLVDQKNQIDQQLMLTHNDIETKNELIREYNLLIAEKQNELGDAIAQRDALNAQYKLRIRAMEERGTLSYWSILFRADSFADLLDRVEMINEIARADSKMIQRLQDSAQQIEAVRQELAAEKVEMEEAKEALAAEQEAMENERMESDKLMAELMADHEEYAAAERKYQAEQADLQAQIASEQSKYQQAVAAEQAAANSGYSGAVSSAGLSWPCAARAITSPFGSRYDPFTGESTSHSGIDIGAAYGAPVYACASGTVTSATYSSIFGYHVRINHGNGFLTLYGHMIRYTVHEGQQVSRGEIIGYVGNSGKSTAPHLHLTLYYYGSLVNPLNYLPSGWYFA